MFKLLLFGSAAMSSFYTICQHSSNFKGYTLFRLGRAGFTVSSITLNYKLFYLRNKPEDENYDFSLSEIHKASAEKLLNLCIANGGCYIKLGQHLGSLTYLLPEEYVSTLKVLHDSVPNELFENIHRIIEEELEAEPCKVFSEISPIPIGTASLAQVHYGRLRGSNLEVAIKVQHREVKDHSTIDIMCMDFLFSLISEIFPQMNLKWLAEETRQNLPKELNFLMEGKNAESLRDRLSKKFSFLVIPKIYWKYSTERLLVMEYCKGGKVTDRNYIESNHLSAKEVSRNICQLYCEMIFCQGYFHSDPHPGNILIRPTECRKTNLFQKISYFFLRYSPRTSDIILLDHGLYQTLTDDFLSHYCRLWLHMIHRNENGIKEEAMALGCKEKLSRLLACMISGRSWQALESGISETKFSLTEGQQMRAGASSFINEMVDVLNSVPRQMLLILKTNDLLRGIEHSLMGTPYDKASMGIVMMTYFCIGRLYKQDDAVVHIFNAQQQTSFLFTLCHCARLLILLYYHLLYWRFCSIFI